MIKEKFIEEAKVLGVNLTNDMVEQFEYYYNKLVTYNEKVNLTAITEKEEVYIKHFLDSIITAPFLKENAKVCDIGAGAGFPSLPLKIVRPDLNVVMVDSLNKRIVFLNELINELNFTNIKAIHSRAEDFAIINKENYDIVVARAVASLNTLCEYCLPLIKVGGYFYAYKSNNILDEVNDAKNAISVLGGKLNEIKTVALPNTDIVRSLVIIYKEKKTPKEFPRTKNKPKLEPL